MTQYRKKLIEVALPLAAINKEAAREKSIRHGHPSTLHLWWARRPLAACRAVLFASLVNDPDDDPMHGINEELAATERAKLFDLIEDLVKWENSNNPDIIRRARLEIARSIAANKVADGEWPDDLDLLSEAEKRDEQGEKSGETPPSSLSPSSYTPYDVRFKMPGLTPEQVDHFLFHFAPPVLDPFCGGGSIPLEAQRLGLRAHASDLNPVPVLITKALIEIPPKFAGLPPVNPESREYNSRLLTPDSYRGAAGLAEDVRYYGQWMRDEAEKRIGHLYPKVKITQAMIDDGRPDLEPYKDQELTVIAWLWARTVASPDPSVGGRHVPLVRSFWLSKKKGKEAYVRPIIDRENGTYEFKVHVGKPTDGFDPDSGTVRRQGGTCLLSTSPIPFPHIRSEGKNNRMLARLMAVVCEGNRGRVYVSPITNHENSADVHVPETIPTGQISHWPGRTNVVEYGLDYFDKLFTPRQLTALTTFSDLVQEAREQVLADAKRAWRTEPRSVNADSSRTTITDRDSHEEQHVYHITFGTYGMRLHGDERPTVHHARNKHGEPFEPPDPQRVRYIRESMTQAPVALSEQQRQFIEETVPRLCERGGWKLHEVAAQKDHVHVLLSANAEAKKVRRWLKTWLAQALNEQGKQAKWWAKGGSCKHVFDEDYFLAAKRYVAKQKTGAAFCESALANTASENTAITDRGSCHSYADAVATYLGFVVNKMADLGNALNRWEPNAQCPRQLFARQAIPMVWDFAEGNPFSESSGSWNVLFRNLSNAFASPLFNHDRQKGAEVIQMDATANATYRENPIVSTDPPYYDNIGYADLSDFFYVWLRRSLGDVYPQLFATLLTPKAEELIASPYRHNGSKQKAAEFFETGLGSAIGQWRKHGNPDYPTTIFYAFKQAETDDGGTASTGWETFLTGVIDHGFMITGTWPMRTEMGSRMVGQGTNALASSVVLVCVPRSADAPLATRREFLNALKRELPDALRNLQSGNIAPVDLAQAAIGPGMAIFSRYAKVVEADGEPMTVRAALTLINQVLDEVLAEQEGEFDADTRWAVAWFEQFGMDEGDFGVAETLSKAKNTSVEGLVEAGVVRSRSGAVQLLGRDTLPDDWDPTNDSRLTEWEAVQHLIRALDQQGETGAADLLRKLGGEYGERARDLAYRLYNICERKGWASEAIAYNSLILAWPEISKLARQTVTEKHSQTTLFEDNEE